ncbi:glycosyltransferase [Rossellomorea sp. NPDC077527]|uniref:CgeB family protein n=1 Tax=Rossellomorea sp. NPDC077527 TaxID=3364510 RepID=UPI0037C89E9C
MKLNNLNVACILDEFSYECFRYDCNLIMIGPKDWKQKLMNNPPHFLFVESAWRGNKGKWQNMIGINSLDNERELMNVIIWCKKNKIPTVFWNKEDPFHFNHFINTAKLFDFIYTTDKNSITNYKKILGHKRVNTLLFAAQPKIHNPIKVVNFKTKNLFFAGTYYGKQHLVRKRDMDLLLKVSHLYGLDIYDRNFLSKTTNFKYPRYYQQYIRGYLEYHDLINACKQYKIGLNVNSIINSPTMCSRRVFEMLASGVTVISNKSLAMENLFKGIVNEFNDSHTLVNHLNKLLRNDLLREKIELKGIRLIMERHTIKDRIRQIITDLGINVQEEIKPIVHVIGIASNYKDIDKIVINFKKQVYIQKTLTIIVRDNAIIPDKYRNIEGIKIIYIDNISNYIEKNIKKSDYISMFNPNNYYGPNYIRDLILATNYTESKIIGKGSYFIPTSNNIGIHNKKFVFSYCDRILKDACIIEKTLFNNLVISSKEFFNRNEYLQVKPNISQFSIDPFNFVLGSKNNHLSEQLLSKAYY